MANFISKVKNKLGLQSNIDFEKTQNRYNNVILNKMAPDSIEVKKDYIRTGDNYTRTMVAVSFRPLLGLERIKSLTEISENVSVVQHLEEYSSEQYRSDISKSIKQNTAKLNEPKLSPAAKASAEKQIEDAQMILRDMETKNERMFNFQLVIHVVANSLDELQQISNQVRSSISSIAKVIYPHLRSKDAFDSFLPLNKNKVRDLTYRPMSGEAVAHFFPFHENEIFEERGIVQGRNLDTNNILLTNDENYLNKHITYIGTTGAGKSTALFVNMMRKYMFNNRVIVIDPKSDFGDIYK